MFLGYIKTLILVVLLIGLSCLAWCWFSPQLGLSLPMFGLRSQTVPNSQNTPEATKANTSELPFQEGKHYKRVSAKITTHPSVQNLKAEDPGKIQVIEFFNYACSWCQRLHPHVNEWALKKSNNIVLYRFPVVFNHGWDVLAKAYYIVEMLGKNEALDPVFFDAVHKNQLNLGNEKKLQEFFEQQGVSEQAFSDAYGSFGINRAFTRGNEIVNAYQIITSPALIVNLPTDSYLITPPMAGSEQAVIQVLEYLIAREAKSADS
jgi:thiol:disulfide interchange protein DsbA